MSIRSLLFSLLLGACAIQSASAMDVYPRPFDVSFEKGFPEYTAPPHPCSSAKKIRAYWRDVALQESQATRAVISYLREIWKSGGATDLHHGLALLATVGASVVDARTREAISAIRELHTKSDTYGPHDELIQAYILAIARRHDHEALKDPRVLNALEVIKRDEEQVTRMSRPLIFE